MPARPAARPCCPSRACPRTWPPRSARCSTPPSRRRRRRGAAIQQAAANAGTWRPPAAFDEYRLIRPIGRGRTGVVFLAHDTLLDRHVAVKFIPSLDDAVLGRFLVEARAAARVQHPNVATLYRVGQLEGRPYLVSEFIRGEGLDRVPRPLEPDRVLPIAIDLARGLAAAHRRGVLHRDLKPGNAILTESGRAVLLDFGLAKLVQREPGGDPATTVADAGEADIRLTAEEEAALRDITGGQLLGTPYFMAPEMWRREEATEQTDLYSLGVLLYELVAGAGPFRSVPLAELPAAVPGRDARPLRAVAPGAPEGLAALIDRCVRRDPAERPGSADDLLAQLEALRPGRAAASVPEGNPYRGLRPFEPEHRAFFFGRQRPLAQAIERLRVEPFLMVTGDSGVGKSSLCAAGIIPAIADGALEDARTWAIGRAVPGRTPAAALASALAPLVGPGEEELEVLLRDDPASLGRTIRRGLPDGGGLLFYIDQLEELVTLAPVAEAEAVSEALGSLAAGLPGIRLLATGRSDFLSRLEALPGLRERVSRGLFLLAPLGPGEVREAVIGPAAVARTRFESDAMIDELVESTVAAEGAMPLFQFALAELWERRDAVAGVIRREALEELGGVEGALSRHADALLSLLRPDERAAARTLLLRLVTVERTRSRRLEEELVALSPHARRVLEALVRGRLLVASETPEGTSYEIAHEALVRGWTTLAGWLVEEAESRAIIARIEAAAAEWRRRGRSRELLFGPGQLAEVAAVPVQDLTPREREFLDASAGAQRRRRWTRRGVVLALLLAGAGVWVGARVQAERELAATIAAELAAADRSLEAARRVDARLDQARAAAFAEYDAGRREEGERAWARAIALRARALDAFRNASEPLERALLLDGSRADVRRRYGDVLLVRALVAEREGLVSERDELVRRMLLYDDGGRLAARWKAPARVELTSDPPGAAVSVARYEQRGQTLVAGEEEPVGRTPIGGLEVAPGSMVFTLRLPGRPPVTLPVLAGRGEELRLAVPLPESGAVPPGFAYVPPGRTLYGAGDEESVRAFFNAVPRHPVEADGFVIGRHETTFAEWIEFLEDLPAEERARRTPGLGSSASAPGVQGAIELRRGGRGGWTLVMQPGTVPLSAGMGEPIRYPGRALRAVQDWRQMPVVGISFEDAKAYAAWLERTRRLPGARLCTEREWERAARGADGRSYPHGDALDPEDANVVETYGKRSEAFGPDEVGSHPRSRSPFGLDDLAGNVWEWVTDEAGAPVARGGSFYYTTTIARIANRETPVPDYRDISVGLRVCSSRIQLSP